MEDFTEVVSHYLNFNMARPFNIVFKVVANFLKIDDLENFLEFFLVMSNEHTFAATAADRFENHRIINRGSPF